MIDFISNLPGDLLGSVIYILPALFVFTIVVFFHELGHYLVGRICGVKIDAFAIGFGPEIFGFNDKNGTRWKLCWIPLGGYVKFYGDENAASQPDFEKIENLSDDLKAVSLQGKPVGQRAAVVAAGPIASFLLAVIIFAGMFIILGKQIIPAEVSVVVEDSAAERAGILPGDVIFKVGTQDIESFTDLQRIVSANADSQLEFIINRGGQEIEILATPDRKQITDTFGNSQWVGILGIQQNTQTADITIKKYSVGEGLVEGVKETYFIVERTLDYLGKIIVGRESADQLGGPIRIVDMSSKVAAISFIALLSLTAILSASIGLINLFPIPMLDGGHLLFYAIEAILGRPLSERAQEYGFRAGLTIVLMLFVFVMWNDISYITR